MQPAFDAQAIGGFPGETFHGANGLFRAPLLVEIDLAHQLAGLHHAQSGRPVSLDRGEGMDVAAHAPIAAGRGQIEAGAADGGHDGLGRAAAYRNARHFGETDIAVDHV